MLDKIKRRLSDWKVNLLSKASRAVLIKSMLSNLPMYYLSLFRMPKTVVKEIFAIQRRSFWGEKTGDQFCPLVNWELIQHPKKLGGLGVGDIVIKNATLLVKWWWRFYDESNSLWKRVVCSCNNLSMERALCKGD